MSVKTMLSIVIPTRNRPESLKACLDALLPQIEGNRRIGEVVVVDDCSEETHRRKVEALCSRPGITLRLLTAHRSAAAARNAGIDAGAGEWIVFLDDDVVPCSDWLVQLFTTLQSVSAKMVGIEGAVHAGSDGIWDEEVKNLTGGAYLTCNIVYRRKALVETGKFDEGFRFGAYAEDHELACRMLLKGSIQFMSSLIVTHQPRKVQLLKYAGESPRRISNILEAERYFYSKHPDRYHLFRRARSFRGTLIRILFRHVLTTVRRRTLQQCLKHPVQCLVMVTAAVIEQCWAWVFAATYFLRREKVQ